MTGSSRAVGIERCVGPVHVNQRFRIARVQPLGQGGTVKLNNHSEKLAGIDVQIPAHSLPRTQPFLVPKTST